MNTPKYSIFQTPVEISMAGGWVSLTATVTARRDQPGWSWWIESVAVAEADIAGHLSAEIHDALAMMAAKQYQDLAA